MIQYSILIIILIYNLGYKSNPLNIKHMLNEIDVNSDGKISFEEFCSYFSVIPNPDLIIVTHLLAKGVHIDFGAD